MEAFGNSNSRGCQRWRQSRADGDRQERLCAERNHSATHLLQKALRIVLGEHVHQAGSSVTADRLRFDFNHMQAMSKQELRTVEDIVNDAIYNDYPVTTQVLPLEEAKKLGATALFGEKYGDLVRVVKMGDFSLEFCGGTHVKNTSSVGMFKILHESAVAAGVRRIEAVTGSGRTRGIRGRGVRSGRRRRAFQSELFRCCQQGFQFVYAI